MLTDVRMPVRDGLWLLERVRQRPRRIPVVAVSAYSDLDAASLQRADFDRVLRKPVDMRELLRAITDLLRER
jgi:two-component system response regulator YesN